MLVAVKWLVRTFLLGVVLAALAFLLVAFMLNTETGTRWVITRANDAVPGTLTVGDFTGTIWRGMQIESLTYKDESQELQIKEIAFDLYWPAIIAGRITIDNLGADLIRRESLVPRPDEPLPLEIDMPGLPLPLGLRTATVARLEIANGDQLQRLHDVVITRLAVDGRRFAAAELRFRRDKVRATVKGFSIRLAGPVATEGDVRWRLVDSDWSGTGSVSGSLTALEFQQDVSGPYPLEISGRLFLVGRVQPEFEANMRWDAWEIAQRPVTDGKVGLRGSLDKVDATYSTRFENAGTEYSLEGVATGNLEALASFSANIRSEQVEFGLTGSLTRLPEFSANGRVTATYIDPQLLHQQLRGALTASADLSIDAAGTLTAENLVAAGDVNEIAVQASGAVLVAPERWRCTSCVLNAGVNRISLTGEQDSAGLTVSASMAAPDLSQLWPGLIGGANAEVTIRDDRGDFVLDWQHEEIAVRASTDALFSDQRLSGTVRSATITETNTGEWRLQEPFAFEVAAQELSLGENRWTGELGTVRISRLQSIEGALQVSADIREVPLQLGNRVLPPNYQLSGVGAAEIDLQRRDELWSGNLNWTQTDTALRVVEINGDVTDVNVGRMEISAEVKDNQLVANAAIEVDPGITSDIELSLDDLTPDAWMTGRLMLSGDDWSWISALVPEVDGFGGAISVDVAARGPLRAPTFTGTANWLDGSISVPALNVQLRNIGVIVTGASDGDATVEGSAKSGGGELRLTGRLEDLMLPERHASFKITGKDAELVNWPEYHLWGSPAIELVGTVDAWHVTGRLDVPRAQITPREAPVTAVRLSPDVVVVGEEGGVARETRITGETRLVLGDDVQFAALGLETFLRGDILFKQVARRPISAEGRLTLVEGTYATQGRNLEIERGELVFTGPLDDPLVDVQAARVIEEFGRTVKAGIRLRGRAQDLTTTVFSEPAMSDADALSYLVLGRPLSQASDSDGNELSSAAVALGLRQVTRITDQIGQSIGIDELSLAGDGGETTALVAGKQVNSRLYARYAYGVFSQLGTLMLRYRLNQNLTLEAGTGENQSLDILYTIEK
jgi:translocation and assembly module TamB